MSGLLLVGGLLLWSAAQAATFVESRIQIDLDDFDYEFADVDGDSLVDLLLTTRQDDGRSLSWYRQRNGAFPEQPDWRMSVPDDVVAYALLDLREEPGKEFILLHRGGVFSVSPTRATLRGNLRREIELPLFPDLALDAALPLWELVQDMDGDGRDELLVISDGLLTVLSAVPREHEPDRVGALSVTGRLALIANPSQLQTGARVGANGVEFYLNSGVPRFFPGLRSTLPSADNQDLLRYDESFTLPGLTDWNEDGRMDVVFTTDEGLDVRLQDASGSLLSFEPLDVELGEDLAEFWNDDEGSLRRRFRDLDGDGREEMVWVRSAQGAGDHVLLVVPRERGGSLAPRPSARLKLSGFSVSYRIQDVDGDGIEDISARIFDVPRSLTNLASVRVDISLQVYRGRRGSDGGGYEVGSSPALRFDRRFRPDEMARMQESFIMDVSGDFNGDGQKDLLLLRPDGLLQITAIETRGEDWQLADEPFSSYRPVSPVRRADVRMLGPDQVSDLVLVHRNQLTIFSSTQGQQR